MNQSDRNNTRVLKHLYQSHKDRARRRRKEFALRFDEFKDIKTSMKCYWTGIALRSAVGTKQDRNTHTFDRIDESLGYVSGNVVPCSHYANQARCFGKKPRVRCKVVNNVTFRWLGE